MCLVRRLEIRIFRKVWFLINAGEEAEITKVLHRDYKRQLHVAQSLKERKRSFWAEG